MSLTTPVVALLDMDCFYVQVEQRLQPSTQQQPAVVVQYNDWRGGGILSVNYEARTFGVTRAMRGDDAKLKCPQLVIFKVPEVRGKADLTKYRNGSAEVFDVICNFSELITVEKASIDEAFLDLTKLVANRCQQIPSFERICDTFLPSSVTCDQRTANESNCCLKHFYDHNVSLTTGDPNINSKHLLIAAEIVKELRDAIYQKTQFTCSAGISFNKMLSKLSCSMKKPNGQTMLPLECVPQLLMTTPIHKVRNLGGKLGEDVKDKLGVKFLGEVKMFTVNQLSEHFGTKTASWLHSLANGIDEEEVVSRLIPKSVGCSKTFPLSQKTSLRTKSQVGFWVFQLCDELVERLHQDFVNNRRVAKLVSIGIRLAGKDTILRSIPLQSYDANILSEDLMRHIVTKVITEVKEDSDELKEPVVMLSLSAAKFVDAISESKNVKLETFFDKIEKTNGEPFVLNAEIRTDIEALTSQSVPQRRGFFYRKTLEFAQELELETDSDEVSLS